MSRPREFDLERVLQTAMRMFWQRGYNGVSIAELSTAMNISAPSLYAAFGSKHDLYRQALCAYQRRPNAISPAVLDNQQPLWQTLTGLLHRAIETATELSPSAGCMVATGFLTGPSNDVAAAKLPAAFRRALLDALTLRFQQAINDGEISDTYAPGTMARYVVALIQGISVQARDGASRADLEQFAMFSVQAMVANTSKPHAKRRASYVNAIGDTPPRARPTMPRSKQPKPKARRRT